MRSRDFPSRGGRLVRTDGSTMSPENSSHGTFVFRGFPALDERRWVLAPPLVAASAAALLGNALLIYVIVSVERLHSPMYLLICSLCVVDLLAIGAIVPSTVVGLLVDRDRVSLAGCLAQMFATHFLSSIESTLLLAMALDRYVAVCHPLRYKQLVGWRAAVTLTLFTLARSGGVMATLVGLAGSLRFCASDVIRHCYCDHMALVSLACGDTDRSAAAGVAVIACFVGVDIPLIVFSYLKILGAVVRAAAPGDERRKAFHTCGTHLMVMMVFYLVGSVTFLSHNLGLGIPTDANSAMGLLYILIPAAANPIIYGVRTAEIRNGFYRLIGFGDAAAVKVSPANTAVSM
ncbi:putative olfactory receptor 52L2 isoform X2 [Phyllopteryx taeniolatus]|uniref:putative olfactory receptor 52L2 isoform X2 n=1 Tax=Phyllopteryx taeniolatus TaxID=161469 RepID=UPI002AD214DF|nr:putative olfactory receptor 52L2 isoform X2 [Phyllopteryx taeniolatus]